MIPCYFSEGGNTMALNGWRYKSVLHCCSLQLWQVHFVNLERAVQFRMNTVGSFRCVLMFLLAWHVDSHMALPLYIQHLCLSPTAQVNSTPQPPNQLNSLHYPWMKMAIHPNTTINLVQLPLCWREAKRSCSMQSITVPNGQYVTTWVRAHWRQWATVFSVL